MAAEASCMAASLKPVGPQPSSSLSGGGGENQRTKVRMQCQNFHSYLSFRILSCN
jgi:hypothetical protein